MNEFELELEYEALNKAVENGEMTEEEARAELWWDSLGNDYGIDIEEDDYCSYGEKKDETN